MAQEALAVALPGHVPPALHYDFDISHDPILQPDLYRGLIALGERAPPMFYTTRYGGHWVVRSHDAIFDITHDYERFSSDLTKVSDNRMMLPIFLDPPEHRDYRKVLLGVFSPKTVNAMLPMIRSLTSGITRALAPTGRCEFVGDISAVIPVSVFMTVMGIPLEMRLPLRDQVTAAMLAGDPESRDAIFAEMEKSLAPLIAARMGRREDDLISRMIDADLGGRTPTMAELQSYVIFLTTAGLDTVTNAMSFTARHLASHGALQRQVRADPTLIPELIEEMLRRYAVSSVLRYVTHDTEFRGIQLKQGERLHLLIPAGNLDATAYEAPAEVILGRKEPAITFGTGVHRCLGSHLARLELRLLFEDVLKNWPDFTLDPGDPPTESGGMTYSVDRLPLRWAVEGD